MTTKKHHNDIIIQHSSGSIISSQFNTHKHNAILVLQLNNKGPYNPLFPLFKYYPIDSLTEISPTVQTCLNNNLIDYPTVLFYNNKYTLINYQWYNTAEINTFNNASMRIVGTIVNNPLLIKPFITSQDSLYATLSKIQSQ